MERFERPDPVAHPPPVDDYLATVVEIQAPHGRVVVQPTSGALTPLPGTHLSATVVHLITAANPFSQPLDEPLNATRNDEAATTLDGLGIVHVPSLGRDADWTWSEPGFALIDADHQQVMDLALAWSQHGVYRWDDHGWWLVLTDGSEPVRYPVEVVTLRS